jgi:flagellar hook-length control protein FliK
MLALDDAKKLKDDSSIEETSGNVLANAENETLAELNLAENKALLKTLLIDSETDKTYTSEKLMQPQQVATDLPHSSKDENVAGNNDIKNILNLSENKLDKVLENIAQRIFDSKNTGESSKDFISALKAGLEEFNNQLSQGREPGIDLKALVSDALAKTNESGSVAKDPINLEKIVKSVSQVLDVAQSMNRVIEQNHDQTYSTSSRDVAHIQGEQSKQIQSNQFESKFEKTINLAKPEGNQQLAEKVRWMMNTKNLVAEIRLDPAELGSMHVKVAISGETATVNFVVQSQQARDAVDTATPKLKEMLAEKGIELGQSSVRQESDGQQGQGDGELAKQGDRGETETEDIEVPEQVFAQHNIINGALGGIDYFV